MFNRIQVILSAQHDLQTNESVSDHKKKKTEGDNNATKQWPVTTADYDTAPWEPHFSSVSRGVRRSDISGALTAGLNH